MASVRPGIELSRMAPPRSEPSKPRRGFIVSPWYDGVFFLVSPLIAVGLGALVSNSEAAQTLVSFHGHDEALASIAIGIFIHAHLFAVFFRSHGNGDVRRSFPLRFWLAPIALFAAMMLNDVTLVTVSVVATFWDVYHSGAQTFGFARLYDVRAGNDPTVGRRLDFWLNQLLYAGPIIGGATMLDHFEDFNEFKAVGLDFFERVPAFMTSHHGIFTWSVVTAGMVFIAWYVFCQWRMMRQGHQISPQKVVLLTVTGSCSMVVWGFNSWGEAFLIMNFFHALQYFALVWAMERPSLQQLFGLSGEGAWRRLVTWLCFVGLAFGYGYFAEASDGNVRAFVAITLVVSIMHFWYDGFIWSVRRRQV